MIARSRGFRWSLVAAAALVGSAVGVGARDHQDHSRAVVGTCQSVGVPRTSFPAPGQWSVVNRQTFDVASLPRDWYPFSGYYAGGTGHDSYRDPSMLAFPGRWMEYENRVYSNGSGGSYRTIEDAGAGEAYPETYNPATSSNEPGYDVATHEWGFQWCARFNGGAGFDTAFAFVPTDGSWPPEIDFIEHLPQDGDTVTLHIHWRSTYYDDGHPCDPSYPTTNSENCHANFPEVKLAVGRWHAYAVTWSASAIELWIDGRPVTALTVTPQTCTRGADRSHGFHDTGVERLCLPNGYVGNDRSSALQPFEWDMQVNSYNGTTTYTGDQTDLAWFEALRP